jgi:2-polyprenyl-6-methoxyphenol hydroxylase-like FAD-dependent oxidoreductase
MVAPDLWPGWKVLPMISDEPETMRRRELPVVVIGGGLAGMAVAMMLAKRELPVVLIERDSQDAFGSTAKYPPVRPGAGHVNRPHNLRAGGRDVLRRSLPEVAREVYALGARDAVEWPGAPDEEHMTVLVLRRSLLERALLSCAGSLPTLSLRFGERVRDLVITEGRRPRVSGVFTSAGMLPARLVIDASGMHGKILGQFSPPRVSLRSRLFFTSQPFQLTGQGFANTLGACAVWIDPPSEAVAHVRLFLHDQPYASVLVVFHAKDEPPSQELVHSTYQAILSRAGLQQYFDGAIPLSPIQVIGFLRSRLGLLDTQSHDPVSGIHQIGDALMAIDPLASKGAALGLIQAEMLASAISADFTDHDRQREALLHAYHEWIVPHWADALIRGHYLRPGADLPPGIAEQVEVALRRGRQGRAIAASSLRSAADNRDMAELVARIAQLQVPPSAIDALSHT